MVFNYRNTAWVNLAKTGIAIGVLIFSLGCSSSDDSGDGTGGPGPMTGKAPDASLFDAFQKDAPPAVPSNSADLFQYLQAKDYGSLASESGKHASPVHGSVQTYFNDKLFESFTNSNTTHPVGSATIKELYSGNTVTGWAVAVKVSTSAGNGDDWYWYENFSTTTNNPVANGTGLAGCAGCHSSGTDFIRTTFPLQ